MFGCWALGGVVIGVWLGFQGLIADWRAVSLASVLLAAVGVWRGWYALPAGALCWDGQSWSLEANGSVQNCQPRVRLDWQSHLLVTLHGSATKQVTCLYLDSAHDPLVWRDLRRALYSQASNTSPSDAQRASRPS